MASDTRNECEQVLSINKSFHVMMNNSDLKTTLTEYHKNMLKMLDDLGKAYMTLLMVVLEADTQSRSADCTYLERLLKSRSEKDNMTKILKPCPRAQPPSRRASCRMPKRTNPLRRYYRH